MGLKYPTGIKLWSCRVRAHAWARNRKKTLKRKLEQNFLIEEKERNWEIIFDL